MRADPSIVILAGPNGAGKTTLAQTLLARLGVTEFINADEIAQQPPPVRPNTSPSKLVGGCLNE